jgi:hypothetical protein
MQIHSVQDQEQNRYRIGKYLLLQIYLTCEQPVKHHHRSGQISCWILEDIFLRCYILRILILHFIISSSCTQRTFLIQGEYCVSVYVFRLY